MATFPCQTITDPVGVDLGYGDPPTIPSAAVPVLASSPQSCPQTVDVPKPNFPQTIHACALATSFDDLINERLLIKPEQIDAGFIATPQVFTAVIWNNYNNTLQTATLNNIVELNTEGIQLTGVSPPDQLPPTQSVVVSFTVSNIGPIVIDAFYTFEYDLQDLLEHIIGFRGAVLINEPLLEGYSESRAFVTNVFRSVGGKEQREQLSNDPIPVRTVNMNIKSFNRQDLSRLENLIRFGSGILLVTPLWFSLSTLTQATSDVDPCIFVDSTANREFDKVDQVVIIGNTKGVNERTFAVRPIDTINPTDIVLDSPPGVGFLPGDFVLPAISATPQQSTSFEFLLERRNSGKLTMVEIR